MKKFRLEFSKVDFLKMCVNIYVITSTIYIIFRLFNINEFKLENILLGIFLFVLITLNFCSILFIIIDNLIIKDLEV